MSDLSEKINVNSDNAKDLSSSINRPEDKNNIDKKSNKIENISSAEENIEKNNDDIDISKYVIVDIDVTTSDGVVMM